MGRSKRAVVVALRHVGQLERAVCARRWTRRRRQALIADVRLRRKRRRMPNCSDVLLVKTGSRVEAAEVWPTARACDVTDHNLATVCDLLDRAEVEYFFVPVASHEQTRIGALETDKQRIWQALFNGELPITTVLIPAGSSPGSAWPIGLRRTKRLRHRAHSAKVWTLYRAVTDPAGRRVLGVAYGCQIEFWSELEGTPDEREQAEAINAAEADTVAADLVEVQPADATDATGGSTRVLVAGRRNRVATTIDPDDIGRGKVIRCGRPIRTTPSMEAAWTADQEWFPIDAVYTWVDDGDPDWRARRLAALGCAPREVNADGIADARYANRDELRYALRSLHLFADFIGHVYLVTDRQTPEWLDTSHPDITVVDHTEIFYDSDVLPTFNSHAIEARIHRIPGLSERYLYINDDVYFARRLGPDAFFRQSGVSTYSCSRALIGDGGASADEYSVTSAAKNGRALMFDEFRRFPTTKIKHTPHAQQRRVIAEIEQRFPEQYRSVGRHQFRAPDDISVASSLHHHVGEALGWAVHEQLPYEYVSLGAPDLGARLDTLLARPRFATWCLNDTGDDTTTDAVEDTLTEFLQRAFPWPSPFEKSTP